MERREIGKSAIKDVKNKCYSIERLCFYKLIENRNIFFKKKLIKIFDNLNYCFYLCCIENKKVIFDIKSFVLMV